uniref:Calmodulin n=1 Tax=Macrostomum lignano TaxID=282301 RepID=A0A1I8GL62_9PLAT
MSKKKSSKREQSRNPDDVMSSLTQEQIHEYYEAFCMYDHDGSGTIDTSELAIIMTGTIDFPEFVSLMVNHINKPVTKEEIKSAFMVFDIDNKGYIPSEELRRILTTRGDRMTEEEADEMIAAADLDGDGMIDYEEFASALVDSD